MNQQNNPWEQLEAHMQQNLGKYGLEMMDAFLNLKEQAEDRGMCPEDTDVRQDQLHEQTY
jgi:hypothetical protein